ASFDADNPAPSSLKLQIRADSLEVTDDVSGNDRREIETTMRRAVLASDRYPDIVFESRDTSIEKVGDNQFQGRLSGMLTLRGATAPVTIPAQITIHDGMLRAAGKFSLSQSKFGLPQVRAAAGTIKLKDELTLNFDIVGRKPS